MGVGIGTGILGSSLLGAGASMFGAYGQSQAAGKASDYARKQINQGRDYLREQLGLGLGYIAPWHEYGLEDLEDLQRIQEQYEGAIQDPSKYIESPGYDWLQKQGIGAIDRSAAARGKLNSSQTLQELVSYNQGLALQDYGGYLGRLENLMSRYGTGSAMGLNTGTQMGQMRNQTALNDLNARMAKAGYYGGGQIGQSNAMTGLLNNLSNIGSNAVNQYAMYNYLQNMQNSQPQSSRSLYPPQQGPYYGQTNLNDLQY